MSPDLRVAESRQRQGRLATEQSRLPALLFLSHGSQQSIRLKRPISSHRVMFTLSGTGAAKSALLHQAGLKLEHFKATGSVATSG
jgi:hypothetical protein